MHLPNMHVLLMKLWKYFAELAQHELVFGLSKIANEKQRGKLLLMQTEYAKALLETQIPKN